MADNTILYFGHVTRVVGDVVYLEIPALGGDGQFGPVSAVILRYKDAADEEQDTYYEKGDRVVVGQVGRVKEDLVVLGRVG